MVLGNAQNDASNVPFYHRQQNLLVKPAETEKEIEAAKRLRYEVFNLEMGEGLAGSARLGLDSDQFDDRCDHLIVIDETQNRVVGTYRLMLEDKAGKIENFYSYTEFDIRPLADLGGRLMELGRSCVHPHYRQGARVINLLLKGISSYIIMHGIDHSFGCTSLHTIDPIEVSAIYNYLVASQGEHHLPRIEPWPHYRFLLLETPVDLPEDRIKAAFPPLLKGYLRLGAFVCGPPALDREFNCSDLFTVFSTASAADRYRSHYVTEDTPAPLNGPDKKEDLP